MPRGKSKQKSSKLALPLQVALLLVQFILIRIGNIPLGLFNLLKKQSLNLKKKTLKLKKKSVYKVELPSFRLPQLLTKGRGRPRKLPPLPYYINRFKIFYRRKIPSKTKLGFGISLGIFLIYIYTSLVFTTAYQLPNPEKLVSTDKALTTEFYDRNGKLLYRMYEGRNRTLVTLKDLPKYLIDATLAAEDKNFYHHFGVDPLAIARAAISNFKNQTEVGEMEGASTITQQLIKNTLLTPEKSYIRKIKEAVLALWAERIYSKDEILQMYLNEAPYGGVAWGVEAASLTYFGENAKDLNLAQASYLAGLPASPTQFSPYSANPELGKVRQKEVLRRMIENKFITTDQAEKAFAENLKLRPQINNILAPHFVMYVKDMLSQKYGQRVVSQGGLKIYTSLDLDIQQQVEKIVAEEANKLLPLNVQNAAAMVNDAKTGQILAMVGSKDYHEPNFGSYNVTLGLRQPGSSIKVVTYASAFKLGYTPGNTILDTPVNFKDEWGNSYSPVNYDGRYHGPVSIRTALGSSYNIPVVKLLSTVGLDEMIQTAKDLGITTFTEPKKYGLSITLGGAEVRMVDMMTAYGAFSQAGQRRISTPILKVTDSDGNTLEEYTNNPTQALTPEIAYLITDILADNTARTPAFGAKSLLNIEGKTVAVKTGTSDNKRDNWTFGYTPQYVVGVWVGNNDNSPMNPALTSGVTGAAPIWNKITTTILKDKPNIAFARPAGIIQAMVDGRRDLVVSGDIPKSLVRVSQKDDKTTFSDFFSTYATPSAQAAGKETATN